LGRRPDLGGDAATALYILSFSLFIIGLKQGTHPSTARRGNKIAAIGMAVAVVGPGGRAVIKPVTLGRDFGSTVEIATGLAASDRVIDNPPDSLRGGDEIRIAAATPTGH